jgi:ATP-dependent Lon protease
VSGISFDTKEGINIMKGYMESGEFSRGKESIRADGSMVFVGNFDVDVEHQQRVGHLFGPLPAEMRDDTAWMDRIHCYLPGWDVPKMNKDLTTDHFGLVSDFFSECMSRLRFQSRVSAMQNRVHLGGALSGRDTNAVNKTVSGLLKLMYPDQEMAVSDEDLEWATRLGLEARRRVKEQQKRVGAAEFRNTHFSYFMGSDGVETFVATPELRANNEIGDDPLEPGQIWAISEGGADIDDNAGLYRIEVNEGPGSGVRILNNPAPAAFKESLRYAEQNLYSRATQLIGDRDPRAHEFSVQLRGFDAGKRGSKLGVAALIAMCSSLLKKSVKGGLIVVGEINLGGSIEPISSAVNIAELAVEKGASALLMPVTARRQLYDLSDDMATKIDIQFYQDARDALLKAILE